MKKISKSFHWNYQLFLKYQVNLDASVSLNSFPLFVTNSMTAWMAPSADCLILSHIAAIQPWRVATSFKKSGKYEVRTIWSDQIFLLIIKLITRTRLTSSFVNNMQIEETILLKTSDGSMEASWIQKKPTFYVIFTFHLWPLSTIKWKNKKHRKDKYIIEIIDNKLTLLNIAITSPRELKAL